MSERRRALGRGLGALIPSGPAQSAPAQRPVDVFFPDQREERAAAERAAALSDPRPLLASGVAPADEADLGTRRDHEAAAAARAWLDSGREATPPAPAHQEAGDAPMTVPANGPRSDPGSRLGRPAQEDPSSDDASARQQRVGAGPRLARTDEADLLPVPGATFAELDLDAIHANAQQPRQVFDEEELEELASSIREVGVLQPVVVRRAGAGPEGDARFELIMGERRWRASRLAGRTSVPAIIRDTAQHDMLRDALLENLHRAQLNPLEEAAAYQQLLDDFGCTHDQLASRVARSRPQITNTLRLLKLPPLVQRRVAAGVLSAGHARALLGLPDGAAMERLAQRIVAEGMSVRATEETVAMGDDPIQPEMRRRPRAGEHTAALGELANRLSDQFDTKVKVNLGQRKGRITIEFAGLQDLDRILGALAPSDPGVLRQPVTRD